MTSERVKVAAVVLAVANGGIFALVAAGVLTVANVSACNSACAAARVHEVADSATMRDGVSAAETRKSNVNNANRCFIHSIAWKCRCDWMRCAALARCRLV